MKNNYYGGATAIADYLRPARTNYIPLVELPKSLNPYIASHGVHMSVKLMNTLPLGNVKSLPAWWMLQTATDVENKRLIEASSGNTVLSLGVMAQYFGATDVTAIASPDVSDGKLALLCLAGVKVKIMKGPICPDPNDPNGAIVTARRLGAQKGWHNAGQYDNDANPAAHEAITGPQIYDQLGDKVGAICAGLGTTGTLLGTARYLRERIAGLQVIGAVRLSNNLVPGVRTPSGLAEVGFDWQDVLTTSPVTIGQKDAYRLSLRLIRAGLLVGPSSGFAVAAALQYLEGLRMSGSLDGLRGKHIVVICPDSPLPYLDDYQQVLDAEEFPAIEGANLRNIAAQIRSDVPEMTCAQLAALYTNDELPQDMVVIDVREKDEYDDHHLRGSQNIPLNEVPRWIKRQPDTDRRRVVCVCRSGRRSAKATHLARQMGIECFNLQGGTTEWSAQGLPRVTPNSCKAS